MKGNLRNDAPAGICVLETSPSLPGRKETCMEDSRPSESRRDGEFASRRYLNLA